MRDQKGRPENTGAIVGKKMPRSASGSLAAPSDRGPGAKLTGVLKLHCEASRCVSGHPYVMALASDFFPVFTLPYRVDPASVRRDVWMSVKNRESKNMKRMNKTCWYTSCGLNLYGGLGH